MQTLTPSSTFDLTQTAAAAHGEESWQRHAAEELWNTVREIALAREEFTDATNRLIVTLAGEVERVERGMSPNSLGVVQGTGREVDRICGRLAQLNERFRRAVNAARLSGVLPAGEEWPTV